MEGNVYKATAVPPSKEKNFLLHLSTVQILPRGSKIKVVTAA